MMHAWQNEKEGGRNGIREREMHFVLTSPFKSLD